MISSQAVSFTNKNKPLSRHFMYCIQCLIYDRNMLKKQRKHNRTHNAFYDIYGISYTPQICFFFIILPRENINPSDFTRYINSIFSCPLLVYKLFQFPFLECFPCSAFKGHFEHDFHGSFVGLLSYIAF